MPTIQGYEKSKRDLNARLAAQNDAQPQPSPQSNGAPASAVGGSKETSASNDPATEKQELMKRMAGPKEKPTDKVKNRQGEHTVRDPTSGQDVVIKDAEFDGLYLRYLSLLECILISVTQNIQSLDSPRPQSLAIYSTTHTCRQRHNLSLIC